MRLEKRIQALEALLLSDPVMLHFADVGMESLTDPRYFLLDLLSSASSGNLSPQQGAQLDRIRKCAFEQELGSERVAPLMQSVMGPAKNQRMSVQLGLSSRERSIWHP